MKNIFRHKMEEKYEHLQDFINRARVPLSFETVRRLIYLNKKITALNLAIIMHKLGYSNAEIKDELLKGNYVVDHWAKYLAEFIDADTKSLTNRQRTILEICGVLEKMDPLKYNAVLELVDSTASTSGLDIHQQILSLKRKGTRK